MQLPTDPNGLIRLRSTFSTAETTERLDSSLTAAGIKVFARIDFSADALAAGLELNPERMLIFGNPKAGTPLMAAQPSVGIDLPLKVLLWEDADGTSWVAYNDPGYITHRHGLPAHFTSNLAAIVPLIERACRG
jgi:uncharacterized protein (DUF302 family)